MAWGEDSGVKGRFSMVGFQFPTRRREGDLENHCKREGTIRLKAGLLTAWEYMRAVVVVEWGI